MANLELTSYQWDKILILPPGCETAALPRTLDCPLRRPLACLRNTANSIYRRYANWWNWTVPGTDTPYDQPTFRSRRLP